MKIGYFRTLLLQCRKIGIVTASTTISVIYVTVIMENTISMALSVDNEPILFIDPNMSPIEVSRIKRMIVFQKIFRQTKSRKYRTFGNFLKQIQPMAMRTRMIKTMLMHKISIKLFSRMLALGS